MMGSLDIRYKKEYSDLQFSKIQKLMNFQNLSTNNL